jgi:hypothetical protein
MIPYTGCEGTQKVGHRYFELKFSRVLKNNSDGAECEATNEPGLKKERSIRFLAIYRAQAIMLQNIEKKTEN